MGTPWGKTVDHNMDSYHAFPSNTCTKLNINFEPGSIEHSRANKIVQEKIFVVAFPMSSDAQNFKIINGI